MRNEPGYIMINDPYYYWENYYNSIVEYYTEVRDLLGDCNISFG